MTPPTRTGWRPRRPAAAVWLATAFVVAAVVLASCADEAPLPGDPLRIASNDLPDAVVGEAYRADVVAVGGLRPYRVDLEEGALPPGLSLQDGVVVGTPTRLGAYPFTLVVTDGNLASTFQAYEIRVRDVPVPTFELSVPDTEVRGETVLRARVANARTWQGARVRLRWDDDAVTIDPDAVERSLRDGVLFVEGGDGRLAIDVAAWGEGVEGDTEVFRFPVEAASTTLLGFDLEIEQLYADRHTFASRRIGASAEDVRERTESPTDADASTDATQDDGGTP